MLARMFHSRHKAVDAHVCQLKRVSHVNVDGPQWRNLGSHLVIGQNVIYLSGNRALQAFSSLLVWRGPQPNDGSRRPGSFVHSDKSKTRNVRRRVSLTDPAAIESVTSEQVDSNEGQWNSINPTTIPSIQCNLVHL